jgi:hypothetical protein
MLAYITVFGHTTLRVGRHMRLSHIDREVIRAHWNKKSIFLALCLSECRNKEFSVVRKKEEK